MRINWQTYYDAAKQCHDLALDLRRADKPVHEAVKGECVGMAGDAPGCKQWGEAYDLHARDTMQVCTHLADALTNFGNILYACGYRYGLADNANPPRPTIQNVSEYRVSIPSSVHDNGDGVKHNGGAEELFSELTSKIAGTFEKLPNGDVHKLSAAASVWSDFGNDATITGAPAKIKALSALFDDMDAEENRTLIQSSFDTLGSSADLLVSASLSVASPVAEYHSSTIEVGEGIKSAMNTFAWAVGLLVTGAIVGAIFSFGGSIAVAGGGVTVAAAETISVIRSLYTTRRLFQILKITLAAGVTVGVIDAFDGVPDLNSAISALAGIIAMRATIDDDSPSTPGQSPQTEATPTDRLKEHLTDRDLDAARRELNGEVVARKPDGTPWNHVQEVRDAQAGLANRIDAINRRLGWPGLGAEERAALEQELSEASRLLDYSEQFVPRTK